ncbi:MAG: tRNA glutamyl-Q(34) synthetase GluQRS [Steroidobacteraceae bacterium]
MAEPPRALAAYIGRFAPSPTGPLHLGSLLAALGSFLDARCHGGRWLVRMEDVDTPRVAPGSADLILRTLEAFGLAWDGEVEYQSRRIERYEAALDALSEQGLTFRCSCSRRELAGAEEHGYPGTCRGGPTRPGPTAWRFRVDDGEVVRFEDRIQGPQAYALRQLGDVIVRRRDGLIAYQLAVTVDDASQAVTDVVRGADLLESTAWQIAIARALGFRLPRFAHLPLVVEPDGSKLAKSRRSAPLDLSCAGAWLAEALRLLEQEPPCELAREPPRIQLDWAVRHFRTAPLLAVRTVRAPEADFAI